MPFRPSEFGWDIYNRKMDLDTILSRLADNAAAPLDVGQVFLELARDEYPNLDVDAYLAELSAMAREARAYVRGDLEARVLGLCRYLFHEMGFRGNAREYYDPRNGYLNQVMDRRKGIPISLSALAMAVGTRAGLEVAGVGLPGHFVAQATEGSRQILFDPFHGGRLLSIEDCETLVEQVTGSAFHATPAHLRPLPLSLMVQRMLNNLKSIYLQEGDFPRGCRVIERLSQLNPGDPLQRRDLGACLLQAGQPGKAMDHLAAYLKAVPQAGDEEAVRNLLRQAEARLALWN